ncbi:MAG: PAS domain S-box protein [Phycisphaerae bacterium]|nr:PAS domain S-box protein [Phycisphaerae bacterium]
MTRSDAAGAQPELELEILRARVAELEEKLAESGQAASPCEQHGMGVADQQAADELRRVNENLRREIAERARAERRIEHLNRLKEDLLTPVDLREKLQFITDAVVRVFDADFARLWMIHPGDRCDSGCIHRAEGDGPHVCRRRDRCLHLTASSGRFSRTDEEIHRRVPFGCYKIGQIASGEIPQFLTNDARNDPRVHDHEWAARLGLVSFAGSRIMSANGAPMGVLALFSERPITSIDQALLENIASTAAQVIQAANAEEALRKNESMFRELVESTPVPVLIWQQDRIVYSNPAAERATGYALDEVVTIPLWDFVHPSMRDLVMERGLARQQGEDVPPRYELAIVTKGGQTKWVDMSAVPIEHDGRPAVLATFLDVTERKEAEAERVRLTAILEATSDLVSMATPDGRLAYMNKAGRELLGWSDDEDITTRAIRHAHPDWALNLVRTEGIPTAIRDGVWTGETTLLRQDGTEILVSQVIMSHRSRDGELEYLSSIMRDVTERRRAEVALRESEERYREFIEGTQDLVTQVDEQGRLTFVNHMSTEIYGLSPRACVGMSAFSFVYPEDMDDTRVAFRKWIEDKAEHVTHENRQVSRSGEVRSLLWTVNLHYDEQDKITSINSIGRDITERKRAEQALRRSEQHFRSLVENASDLIAVLREDGTLTYASPPWQRCLGYEFSELFGRNVFELIHPDDRREILSAFLRGNRLPGHVETRECRFRHRNGSWRHLEATGTNLLNDPVVRGVVINARDVTAHKKAEDALQESEAVLRATLESTQDGILVVSQSGRVSHYNSGFQRIWSIPDEMMASRDDGTLVEFVLTQLADPEQFVAQIKALYQSAKASEDMLVFKDGRAIERRSAPLIRDGREDGRVWYFRDVTERKRAEEQRLAHLNFLESLEQIDRVIRQGTDLEQTLGDIVEVAHSIFGCDRAWLLHPCDPEAPTMRVPIERTSPRYEGAFAAGRDIPVTREAGESMRRALDAEDPIIQDPTSGDPLPDVVRVFSVQSQIFTAVHPKIGKPWLLGMHQCSHPRAWTTEEQALFREIGRRIADALSSFLFLRELRENEERMQLALDAANEGMWDWRVQSGGIYLSPRWHTMLGYEPGELPACYGTWTRLLHPDDREPVERRMRDHVEHKDEGFEFEFRMRTKSGHWRWILCRGKVVERSPDGQPVRLVGTNSDVTDRKQAEAELMREKAFSDTTIDSLPGVFYLFNEQARFLRWNRNLEDVLGYSTEELSRIHVLDLFTGDDRALIEQKIQVALVSGQAMAEANIISKDGQATPYLFTGRRLTLGEATCILGMGIDISERRRAEEQIRRLNTELEGRVVRRTAELQAANTELEAFCYSVSHDLRAPLRRIDGFSQALLDDYPDRLDEQGQDYLNRVRASAQRMGMLIDDLLRLSRITQSEMRRKDTDLSQMAREIADGLRDRDPDRAVDVVIEDGIRAECDAQLLRAVLENLFENAWKFTGKRPRARVEFGSFTRDEERVYLVRDNGAGFDMAYAERLFGAFQRLHSESEYEGTGIGLATVRRVIRRHGGRVWAEGAVDQGATFYFTLHPGHPTQGVVA